jgi:hypothetical protein
MLLNHLLDQDKKYSNGLRYCFGDSYLFHKFRIFKNIRLAALEGGFDYDYQKNDDYLALPLSQIENILARKKIPYFDNKSTLEKLEASHPNLIHWSDIQENLKRNFHFHESCHAVARQIQLQYFNQLQDPILLRLIEESFSNTCELLAVVDCKNEVDRIFYEINSYTSLFELSKKIEYILSKIEFEKLFFVVLLNYLHSNHLHDSIQDAMTNQFFESIGLAAHLEQDPQLKKNIKFVLKYCFYLDENFKKVTTGFYLKLNFRNGSIPNLKNKNYWGEIKKNMGYFELIEKLSRLATL